MIHIKYYLILIVFIFINSTNSIAQKLVPFDISFHLKEKYRLEKNDSIQIESCKFYISNINFYSNSSVLYSNSNFFKFVDFKSDSSLIITTQIPSNLFPDCISFDIGIDSNINKLGIQGGDLDPTNGMYWSWQSGYINFKLEGYSPKCNSRKNKFQYHIGGFTADNYSLQTVFIQNINRNNASIDIDLYTFFHQIDLEKETSVMVPGKRAVEIAKIVKGMFRASKK